jgi:hypothetical protein
MSLVNTRNCGDCRDWGQSMRDTIQLPLFDPTVPEAGPTMVETISFEDAVRRAQTGAKLSTQERARNDLERRE